MLCHYYEIEHANAALAAVRQKAAVAAAAAAKAAAQLAALNEAEKAAGGVCQDGWHAAALKHSNALFNLKEADAALAALRQKAAEQKEWDERYAAAVEEDERYFAGRTFDQVVADEEKEAAAEKRAQAVAEVKNHIVFNPEDEEDEEDEDEEDEDEEDDEDDEDEEVKTAEWTCQTCSAVWRTKTKTD
jgi:hypothetical protein